MVWFLSALDNYATSADLFATVAAIGILASLLVYRIRARRCASYHPGKNAPLNVLDLPFLPLDSLEVMRKVHDAVYAHPASNKALAKWNAHIYMSNMLPQYEYMGKGKPPSSVADFKGMRLRALGGMGRAAKLLGATPSTVPAGEVYTALQRHGRRDRLPLHLRFRGVQARRGRRLGHDQHEARHRHLPDGVPQEGV